MNPFIKYSRLVVIFNNWRIDKMEELERVLKEAATEPAESLEVVQPTSDEQAQLAELSAVNPDIMQ
eukprot:5527271-Pyramimonas_sp.AAC.1